MAPHRLAFRARRREILGMVAVSLVGLISLAPFCSLREKSLDYLFAVRHRLSMTQPDAPRDVAIVFMNDGALGDWTPYMNLLRRLAEWRAKAVVLDIVFTDDLWKQGLPAFSETLSNATASANLKVVFASEAALIKTDAVPKYTELLLPDIRDLASQLPTSATNGLANLQAHKSDRIVRSYSSTGMFGREPLAFAIARLLTGTEPAQTRDFWINYYGPPGVLTHYNFGQVVEGADTLRSEFEGKVVFVGEGPAVTNRQPSLDRHLTPFTRSTTNTSSGVEIHATAFANIMQGSEIQDLAGPGEGWLVLLVGLVSGYFFVKWTPQRALAIAGGCAALVSVSFFLLFEHANRFFPWLVIAAMQMPTAFAVSLIPVKSAFISYRALRDGDKVAKLIAEGLQRRGIEVYLDKEDGQAGHLEKVILPEVEKRRNFILVVTLPLVETGWVPGTKDWVGEEIARALDSEKVVLPVYVDDVRSDIRNKMQAGVRPVYKATYSPQHFVLEQVLGGQIFEEYRVKYHDSSIEQIALKLTSGLRKNWGERPEDSAHANPMRP